MTAFSIVVCVLIGALMLVSSTIPGRNEPWSHRLIMCVFGLALFAVAMHVGGVLP